MDFLPIFLNLNQRRVLVVGGGDVAARKVGLLLRAQASVHVVAPELCANLVALREGGEVRHTVAGYHPDQLADSVLVFAATNDETVNAQVSADAKQRGIPVNVADRPALCSFILPSIVDRSPITVAVSTGGASPTLGRLLRARLETFIPAHYGRLADLMGRYRDAVKNRFPTFSQRRRFWEDIVQGPVAEMVLSGRDDAAQQALEQAIQSADDSALNVGEVYLVGAGPGDPDLLTFRALRLMQQADVVLHDRLVSPRILDLVRREAERVYVGKRRSYHAVRQDEINRLLIDLAKQGKRVLRLKGGDPFIFGRGGEEIAGLAAQGIPFQVVPAVTAANGCASYAGIPLTHRDYAQSVAFVTGQLKDGTVDLNWPALIQRNQTLVVYMGLAALAIICRELVAHGMAPDTPIALVEQGTLPKQRVYTGTLQTLPGEVEGVEIHAPTLLIVGEVVKLHGELAWYSVSDG